MRRVFTIACRSVPEERSTRPDRPARRGPPIAVVGAGRCDRHLRRLAWQTGHELARAGAVVLTGGRSGVMQAASAGARAAGGLTVGVLPGADAEASPPNDAVEVAIYTGMGQARNQVLVLSAAAVIAVGGSWGTLSEIALALKHRRPVVTLGSWSLAPPDGTAEPLLKDAADPQTAVRLALAAAKREGR